MRDGKSAKSPQNRENTGPVPNDSADTSRGYTGGAGMDGLLAAMLDGAVPVARSKDIAWEDFKLDESLLARSLAALTDHPERKKSLADLAQKLPSAITLRRHRTDAVRLRLSGRELRFSRPALGEALGVLGAHLLPTRRRALEVARAAAREMAFLGAREPDNLWSDSPLCAVLPWANARPGEEAALFREMRPDGSEHTHSAWKLLNRDPAFLPEVNSAAELSRFRLRLRQDPLDGAMVTMLRPFFSRRATVGPRDTARWALGSRHPWFGWNDARAILTRSFERFGREDFWAPRLMLYLPDPRANAKEAALRQALNQRAASRLAGRLQSALPVNLSGKLSQASCLSLSYLALDYYFDHPEFDLENRTRPPARTLTTFLGHAVSVLATDWAGRHPPPLRNRNIAAAFDALGEPAEDVLSLSDTEREELFSLLLTQAEAEAKQETYQPVPRELWVFSAAEPPRPLPGERVLDEFALSELRAPQHMRKLREHPELAEKLVVFFCLTVRHLHDTGHLPDLAPEGWRDHWLLGLWGDCARTVRCRLYENPSLGAVRTEVRFFGTDQTRVAEPSWERGGGEELVRRMIARIQPDARENALRALSKFVMVLAERKRARKGGRLQLAGQALEVFREAARTGLRGALVDAATTLEMVVDQSVDAAQYLLQRAEHLMGRKG